MKAIERIIGAIPAEAGFSETDRDEARTLLMACVLWALPHDGPGRNGIEELRGLTNGFGCWLGWVRRGINSADLSANERGFFLGGFGMATALLLSFSLTAKPPAARPSPSRAPKKRAAHKSIRQAREIRVT